MMSRLSSADITADKTSEEIITGFQASQYQNKMEPPAGSFSRVLLSYLGVGVVVVEMITRPRRPESKITAVMCRHKRQSVAGSAAYRPSACPSVCL